MTSYEQYNNQEFIEFEKAAVIDDMYDFLAKVELKGVVVDIGSGPGTYLKILKPTWARFMGIEPVKELREISKKVAEERGIKCEFLEGKGENLPLEDDSADVILSTYAFNELGTAENIRKAMQEIKRIGKTGTKLIICDLTGGIKDGYYSLINTADIARGEMANREMADVWIEIFSFLSFNADVELIKKLRLNYVFDDRADAIERTKALFPDIETDKNVREAVEKFYSKPGFDAEGLLVVAKLK